LVARFEPGVIHAPDGQVILDADAYTPATSGDCPDTVNPSLWRRQCQRTPIQGLFEVTTASIRYAAFAIVTL
jgi:alkyl sulfatase BDS1-like metallo-beta-lactamase superfamily hydrolase